MQNYDDIIKEYTSITASLASHWADSLQPRKAVLSEVLNMLSDDDSKEVFSREIISCMLGNFLKPSLCSEIAGLMKPDDWNKQLAESRRRRYHEEIVLPAGGASALDNSLCSTFHLGQYEYKDRVRIEEGDVCIDCGAMLGETSIWMLEKGAAKSFAFEVDPSNCEAIRQTLSKGSLEDRITLINRAVSSKNGVVRFVAALGHAGSGHIVGSSAQSEGSYEAKSCTLDDFCSEHGVRPDFIKMDIEGAELDAIAGAKRVFKEHRPKFAICIYHKWEHRWQIALALKDICQEYNFYIKKSHPIFETVLFGVPCEKLAGKGKQRHTRKQERAEELCTQLLAARPDLAEIARDIPTYEGRVRWLLEWMLANAHKENTLSSEQYEVIKAYARNVQGLADPQ